MLGYRACSNKRGVLSTTEWFVRSKGRTLAALLRLADEMKVAGNAAAAEETVDNVPSSLAHPCHDPTHGAFCSHCDVDRPGAEEAAFQDPIRPEGGGKCRGVRAEARLNQVVPDTPTPEGLRPPGHGSCATSITACTASPTPTSDTVGATAGHDDATSPRLNGIWLEGSASRSGQRPRPPVWDTAPAKPSGEQPLQKKHLSAYVTAASSCIWPALGATHLDGGTAEVIGGVALIILGVAQAISAVILGSVHGPDPLFWQPIKRGDTAGKVAH
jgi:hypothetical protein